jgi:hypothetical protein
MSLKAPFPYFGGKRSVAPLIWRAFGDVLNYVEPFAGSLAVLLARPTPFDGTETVNDADGLISNFWRAVKGDPEAVAFHADWPVNENDLHARHSWLVGQKDALQSRLEGDPDYFDAKVAGWWVWGICAWIGGGWCSGQGPWQVITAEDGTRQLAHLGDAGQGVNRQRAHLGDAGQGVNRKLAHLGDAGRGVNRQRAHLGNAGQEQGPGGEPQTRGACDEWSIHLRDMMRALSDRLRRVRVCSGDWSRVCGETPTIHQGLTAVLLDPPYSFEANRDNDIYRIESGTVAHTVREWAIAQGGNPLMRICLAGYEGEHTMPATWECVEWKARGGFGSRAKNGNGNAARERLWFSPYCVHRDDPMPLFKGMD